MAHLYVGNPARLDPTLRLALATLPDDYWVFAEFSIDRNIDCFICRAAEPDAPYTSTLIALELKCLAQPVRGDVDGPWDRRDDSGAWVPLPPATARAINPYRQAVDAAEAVTAYLWNQQPRYRQGATLPRQAYRVWPDLLLLSPEGVMHQLPLRPRTGYGLWYTRLDPWLAHVQAWTSRAEVRLSPAELTALAALLGLQKVQSAPQLTPSRNDSLTPLGAELVAFAQRLTALEQRLAAFEGRSLAPATAAPQPRPVDATTAPVRQSGATLLPFRPPTRSAPASTARTMPTADRALTDPERLALVTALTSLTAPAVVPAVVDAMNGVLGYCLKERAYNGFGSATALLARARAEGLVTDGPPHGTQATVALTPQGQALAGLTQHRAFFSLDRRNG